MGVIMHTRANGFRNMGAVLLAALVWTGCGAPSQLVRHQSPPIGDGLESVAVVELQMLHEMEATPQEQWFERGNAVGFIQHRGGYVEPSEAGSRVHSKETVITMNQRFREYLTAWHSTQVTRFSRESGVRATPASLLGTPPVVERSRTFGEVSESGTDNVNIPHLVFRPQQQWDGAKAYRDEGNSAVLIPVTAYYYGHNPGWFYGQTWGCSSGARARLLWLLYDAETGALLGWWDLESLLQEEEIRQPEEGVIEQMAAEVLNELADLLHSEVAWK